MGTRAGPLAGGQGPAIRLFCFAHAGGGAAVFRPWQARLGPQVEVCPVVLPGREARWREPPCTSMDELIAVIMRQLRRRIDRPFALFGHSLGAAVAYELCRKLFPTPDSGPVLLLVSGRRAPHVAARGRPAHRLPREDFVAYLRSLNGIPPEVAGHPQLLDAFLPVLRADFGVNETYAPPREPRLRVAVSAFLGADDPLVNVADMLCWRDVTTSGFRLRVFTGDHFYLRGGHPDLLTAIGHDLLAATAVWTEEKGGG